VKPLGAGRGGARRGSQRGSRLGVPVGPPRLIDEENEPADSRAHLPPRRSSR
jgi:hypothetical protein